jgi:CelD/BcsL family acetyltransferase involved in cellulose biosynthesis
MALLAKGLQRQFANADRPADLLVANQAVYISSVIRTLEQFKALAPEWNALLHACGETNIALTHDWISLWLETFSYQQLFVVLIRDSAGLLVAAAPLLVARNASGFFCRSLRRLQFIGSSPEVYDWMQILVHPSVKSALMLEQISDKILRHRSRWDVLDLRYFKDMSQAESLFSHLHAAMQQLQMSQPMSIPYIELADEWADYLAHTLKRKARSDLKRIHNHIQHDFEGSRPELVIHLPGPASDERLQSFLKAHQAYWRSRGCRTEYTRHQKLLGFFLTVYKHFSADQRNQSSEPTGTPVFEFSTLELGGQPVSYHFDIQSAQGCMGYLSCYEQQAKKYRPGILHIEALIERTHQLGGRRFEFGRGDEHYKNQWAIQKTPLWNLLGFRSPLSQWAWRLDQQLHKAYQRLTTLKLTLITRMTPAHGSTRDSISD